MKKKIISLVVMFALFTGVVSASSINGDYKGNPIVNVKSNGKALETDEVPAMVYDGHTVVPISLLRQLGASVTWDQSTYSVDVKLPSGNSNDEINAYLKMANDAEMLRYIYFINDQLQLANIINNGILQNSVTKENYQTVISQANRLATDYNANWVNNLSKISYYSEDVVLLNDLTTRLNNIKDHLIKLDAASISDEFLAAKKNINTLYFKYDSNLKNDVNDAFDKTVKYYNSK